MKGYKHLKPVGRIALILVMLLQLLPPLAVGAQEAEQKIVRVGWYESAYCCMEDDTPFCAELRTRESLGARKDCPTQRENIQYARPGRLHADRSASLPELMKENWLAVLLCVTAVFVVILLLLVRKLNAERRIRESLQQELARMEQTKAGVKVAYTDELTGVKSKHAFAEAEDRMDRRLAEKDLTRFAIVLFNLNGLQKINDTKGHEAGDKFIKDACRIICVQFKHSPVFRIGGDEFVAILEGSDYENREELMDSFERQMENNLKQGDVTIASGYACYDPSADKNAHAVLERANKRMYERKKQMKGRRK